MLDTPVTDPASMAWLDTFPSQDGTVLISENRPFQHDEADYDNQYGNQDLDTSGRGLANVLRKFDCDLSGPVLELGCGTGVATVGLCKAGDVPWFLITDSSTAFIDITKRKLARNGVDPARVRYAVLSDGDLDRLPEESVSAIVLRSVVHHFLDVPGWIRAAARALRPGGVIVCEEPAAQGYLIMGIIAQTVAENEANGLTPDQRAKARLMAETMKAYNRCDIDKSTWEDKHLFRPEEMNEWARAAGLEAHFIPSANSESFADDPDGSVPKTDFRQFFESYLQYCMNFGEADSACIARTADAICSYIVEACSGTREPYLMGLFALRKPWRVTTTNRHSARKSVGLSAAPLSLPVGVVMHPSAKMGEGVSLDTTTFGEGRIAVGARSELHDYVRLHCNGGWITIGDDCSVNPFTALYGHGGLTIGNKVRIATHVVIVPVNHIFADPDVPIMHQPETRRGVTIEDDVWIGANAVVLDGVTIHRGSVVGAGAVVTRSVPPMTVVAGSPARIIKHRLGPEVRPQTTSSVCDLPQDIDTGAALKANSGTQAKDLPRACCAVISAQNTPVAGVEENYSRSLGPVRLTWVAAGEDRGPPSELPKNVQFLDAGGVGLVSGRNKVLKTADTEIVVFLDDDLTLPSGWYDKILEPFADPDVHIVGCRYLPDYEHAPPSWIDQLWHEDQGFRYLWPLSLLDGGAQSRFCKPTFVFGLCFAARRKSLIELGGFHPDAYPWHLRRWRGDGETGICVKAETFGMKAFYQAETHVLHKVPAERMTTKYLQRRAFLRGISLSYSEIRRGGIQDKGAMVFDARYLSSNFEEIPHEEIISAMHLAERAGYVFHQSEARKDASLLAWIRQADYFDRSPQG